MAKTQHANRAAAAAQQPANNGDASQASQPGPAAVGMATMGLDDSQPANDQPPATSTVATQPTAAESRGRVVDEGRPYCPRHNCLLVANASKATHTNYACPVAGCDSRARRVRSTLKVPTQPQMCRQRTCDEVALEVDQDLTTVAQLHMVCPKCKFSLKVPRPGFAPQLERQRRMAAAEDLAAR